MHPHSVVGEKGLREELNCRLELPLAEIYNGNAPLLPFRYVMVQLRENSLDT